MEARVQHFLQAIKAALLIMLCVGCEKSDGQGESRMVANIVRSTSAYGDMHYELDNGYTAIATDVTAYWVPRPSCSGYEPAHMPNKLGPVEVVYKDYSSPKFHALEIKWLCNSDTQAYIEGVLLPTPTPTRGAR